MTTDKNKLLFTDDAPIFKFLNPNSNDRLSQMSGLDLQELIVLLDDYYIQLRSRLGFDDYITFGLEIEFEYAAYERVRNKINEAFDGEWVVKHDNSLNSGAEINSPILRDTEESWKNLDSVCQIISPLGTIGTKSGGHIHIGTQTIGDQKRAWLNFIKLWSVYENIIFRFTYGDFLTCRPNIQEYAVPMTKRFWPNYLYYNALKESDYTLPNVIRAVSHKRFQAVNFNNVDINNCNRTLTGNTIEFRCPNSSFDPAIWQNNVNLLVRTLLYSKSDTYDDDIIERRHDIVAGRYDNLKWYDEVYLDQALELSDLLFDNNFDKVYFLKQYLKSFQVSKYKEYSKTRLSRKGIKEISHI